MGTADESPISAAVKVCPEEVEALTGFLNRMGVAHKFKPEHNAKVSLSDLVGGVLKVISIRRGEISSSLCVKSPILNAYGGMHGGATAAVAERVAIACARTVVGKDKDIFLSELSISYLSAAPKNIEVLVDGSVLRSGRNITVVGVNFKDSGGRFVARAHVTFYNMPVSSL